MEDSLNEAGQRAIALVGLALLQDDEWQGVTEWDVALGLGATELSVEELADLVGVLIAQVTSLLRVIDPENPRGLLQAMALVHYQDGGEDEN